MFKRFCIVSLSIVLALVIAAGSAVYIIDPFNHYRADADFTKIIYQMPYCQNTGIAEHTKYDTLISGSSMTQNFRAYWFDEKAGCKAIRLSFDGGLISDFRTLFDVALENNKELKSIYFGLDNYMITGDSALNDRDERIPEYLVDGNPFTDIKYLINKDVLFNYIPTYFSYKNYSDYDFYEMQAWDNNDPVFSKEAVLKDYTPPESREPENDDLFYDECQSFSDTICPVIEAYPDVQFTFFAPPYSILYWHTQLTKGTLDATLSALKKAYSTLLEYENVRIFYFQNDLGLITDFDNYKDANHYSAKYNKYMVDCFYNGEYEINKFNLDDILGNMKSAAQSFDYGAVLGN